MYQCFFVIERQIPTYVYHYLCATFVQEPHKSLSERGAEKITSGSLAVRGLGLITGMITDAENIKRNVLMSCYMKALFSVLRRNEAVNSWKISNPHTYSEREEFAHEK